MWRNVLTCRVSSADVSHLDYYRSIRNIWNWSWTFFFSQKRNESFLLMLFNKNWQWTGGAFRATSWEEMTSDNKPLLILSCCSKTSFIRSASIQNKNIETIHAIRGTLTAMLWRTHEKMFIYVENYKKSALNIIRTLIYSECLALIVQFKETSKSP